VPLFYLQGIASLYPQAVCAVGEMNVVARRKISMLRVPRLDNAKPAKPGFELNEIVN
jgi:hypothetical protein